MGVLNILQKIIATKHQEVAAAQLKTPLAELQARCAELPDPRNFFAAVTQTPKGLANVIAEVKRASPSAGIIRGDFDPVAIAQAYEAAGAEALSVLTDEQYFHGRLEYIQKIRNVVKLPVLRKDFIVDPYQVWQTRAAGADAMLLIAEALSDAQLLDLQILATELRLTTLIEVHAIDSLLRVRSAVGFPMRSYSLLGINNRDLTTFSVDLGQSLRVAEFVADREILVSESGIKTRADVEKLAAAGIHILLIGETLMRSGDMTAALQELRGK